MLRFRQGVVFVPRGNGKTTFAAPLALYMTFLCGEGGAEGYAAAVTRDQARIMFDAALNMVRRSPDFRRFAKRRLLAGLEYVPRVIVAGKLTEATVSLSVICFLLSSFDKADTLNNRAENSHRPTRLSHPATKKVTGR